MPGSYLRTLGMGLDVLVLLKEGPARAADIAAALRINRAAAYRLLHTLEAHRFVERTGNEGRYRLTVVVWELGTAALTTSDVRALARQHIGWLSDVLGETVHLAIYDAGEVVYIDKTEGTYPLRSYTRLGGRAPAYCVATGKALLAHQPPEEIDRLLSNPLQSYSANTITRSDELRAELDRILRNGVAVNRGEWNADIGGIAVPIRRGDGTALAALGISGPVVRMMENEERYIGALLSAAEPIERAISTTTKAEAPLETAIPPFVGSTRAPATPRETA